MLHATGGSSRALGSKACSFVAACSPGMRAHQPACARMLGVLAPPWLSPSASVAAENASSGRVPALSCRLGLLRHAYGCVQARMLFKCGR